MPPPLTPALREILGFLNGCIQVELHFHIAGAPVSFNYEGRLEGDPHKLTDWIFYRGGGPGEPDFDDTFELDLRLEICETIEVQGNGIVARSAGHELAIYGLPPRAAKP